jgi:rhamnulokinase
MTVTANYLAIDLGASSGRAMLGCFDGAKLTLEELHRFENGPVRLGDGLYWDALRLFEQIKAGLARCTQRGIQLDAVGIDTWGVDFGLMAGNELLSTPRHYRDPRNTPAMEQTLARVPRAEIYQHTGIQFLPFNTLFQLAGVARHTPRLLELADRLLFMPDLFAYWLTGAMATEPTIASTSQMLDPRTAQWSRELLKKVGLPARLLPAIEATGSIAGTLLPHVAAEVGQSGLTVIRTASHDTAAAVVAVPMVEGREGIPAGPGVRKDSRTSGNPKSKIQNPKCVAGGKHVAANWAYISSGTWSLIGVELPAPLINADALAANFTNELGVGGTVRFLRNVAGLWLVQESQRAWAAQGQSYTHEQLAQMAAAAPAFAAFVDPDDARFAEPGDAPARIRDFCADTGQPAPETPGAVVRCVLESLALKYRRVLGTLERLIGRTIDVLHVVGGGSRNGLLNQFTANATGKPVIAGPVEATAAGNLMVQALAQGRVSSPAEIRQVIAASSDLRRYEPRDTAVWTEAYARFEAALARCGVTA